MVFRLQAPRSPPCTPRHNGGGTIHLANVETFSGALVWPLQGPFRQNEKRRANGYDGFNQALKTLLERRTRP
jgi:hypothetical protein